MNKQERGIIKWAPFHSLVGQRQLIDNVLKEKKKISKPKLSQEQMEQNEKLIIEAFYEQIKVCISYFKEGLIYTTTANITQIDYTFKKIYLNNQKILLFTQIIEISML